MIRTNTDFDYNNNLKVDIDSLRQCLAKLKLNKSSGVHNISAEHLVYCGIALQIHLCLLFNAMLQHCYVPEGFGFSLIIPLLKGKHGDMTQSNMYRGILLSPVIAKLFEYVLLEFYEDQLTSDSLQFGFKKAFWMLPCIVYF